MTAYKKKVSLLLSFAITYFFISLFIPLQPTESNKPDQQSVSSAIAMYKDLNWVYFYRDL